MLYQIIDEKVHWISFVARALQKAEKNYSATKKELFAIVFALIRFHPYLWGGPKFTLFTDHKALIYMREKPVVSPISNWLETLMSFQFDVVHRPGIANILQDHLSRLFSTDQTPAYSAVDLVETDKHNGHRVQLTLGAPSSSVGDIIPMRVSYMKLDPKEAERQVVPEASRSRLLDVIHARGHFGAVAMVKAAHEEGKTWLNLR